MSPEPDPQPDERGIVIYVGQDQAGHWLVQDSGRTMEGRFVSRTAALSFAEAERQTHHARLQIVGAPLVPVIPFDPPVRRARTLSTPGTGQSVPALETEWRAEPVIRPTAIEAVASVLPARRAAIREPRWPKIASALADLRGRGRTAVRIVDADCACGALLIEATRHARALGFTAIEGRGIDGSPTMIGRARAAAARLNDPAIGLEFHVADLSYVLEGERDAPADIILWHGRPDASVSNYVRAALAAAGEYLILDLERPRRQAA